MLNPKYFQLQKTEAIKKETEKLRAIADAERNKAVLKIQIEERILEKEQSCNEDLRRFWRSAQHSDY